MKRGSVLILALWVLFFLGALAVAIGTRASACIRLAEHLKVGAAADALARAGVERAVLAIEEGNADQMTGPGSEFWSKENKSLDGGIFSVFHYSMENGQIVTNFGVVCESARTNINSMSEIKSLLENTTDVVASMRLTESVREYRQAKKLLTQDGVNGKFQSVHELLLVEGMTSELLSALLPDITPFDKNCYRGVALGRLVRDDSGAGLITVSEKQIVFVYDRKASKMVYWGQ